METCCIGGGRSAKGPLTSTTPLREFGLHAVRTAHPCLWARAIFTASSGVAGAAAWHGGAPIDPLGEPRAALR